MDPIMLVAGNAATAGEQPDKTKGISLEPGAPSFGELLMLLKPLEGAERKVSATDGSTAAQPAVSPHVQKVNGAQAAAADDSLLARLSGKDLLAAVSEVLDSLLGGIRDEAKAAVAGGLNEISAKLEGQGLPKSLVETLPQLGGQLGELLEGRFPGLRLVDIALEGSGDAESPATEKLSADAPDSTAAEESLGAAAVEISAELQPEGSELISWLSTVLESAAPAQTAQTSASQPAVPDTLTAARPLSLQLDSPEGSISISLQEVTAAAAADAQQPEGERRFSLLVSEEGGTELRASLVVRRADSQAPAAAVAAPAYSVLPGQVQPAQVAPGALTALSAEAARLTAVQPQTEQAAAPALRTEVAAAGKTESAPAAQAVQAQPAAAARQGAMAVASPQTVLAGAAAAQHDSTETAKDTTELDAPASGMAYSEKEAAPEEMATLLPSRRRLPVGAQLPGYASASQLRPEAELSRLGGQRRTRFSAELALSPLGSLEQSSAAAGGAQISFDTQAARLIEFSSPATRSETAALPQLNHRVMAERVMEHAARFKAAGDGLYIAHLSLNPENLGEMHVNISVRGENVALQIAVVSTVAREQLQSSLNALRQSLVEGGLNVAELRVINIKPDERGGGNQRRQEQQNQGNADDNNRGGNAAAKETSPLPG